MALTLDPALVATLLADLPKPAAGGVQDGAFSVAPITGELLDAWLRMLRLMDRPEDIAAPAPASEREILYRVLQGPHGWMLRDMASPGTALARIAVTIHWLRRHFAEPFKVETLADMAALSISAFHRHFKAVTALSPLQYQKRLRLLKASSLPAT